MGEPAEAHDNMRRMTTDSTETRPGDAWRRGIADSAPPQAIADAAPPRERFLEPERFRWDPEADARQPTPPSRLRAMEALPDGGTVIDVGVGGGKASLGLASRAGLIIGVDPSEDMLASFTASAAALGVAARGVLGSWPEIGAEVEPADVVVSNNAVYGLTEIEDFVEALTAHARHRVVIDVSNEPPPPGMGPLWKAIHGTDRPFRPVADDLEGVLVAMGLKVERDNWVVEGRPRDTAPGSVAFFRRRLMVGEDRDAEIAEVMRTLAPTSHTRAALWWPGTA
jgi:SAM-dependent methyltransferase